MMDLAFLRHGVTGWNQQGRIQGRADTPLAADAIAALSARQLPAPFGAAPVFCSPLARARETAALLGLTRATIEPRLIETDWGAFEGRTLEALRAEQGARLAAAENLGLDFRPPGGESPREVAARLKSWLSDLAARKPRPASALAITHKGVMRAALTLAYGWDMRGKPPLKLQRDTLLVLTLRDDGSLVPEGRLIALEKRPALEEE